MMKRCMSFCHASWVNWSRRTIAFRRKVKESRKWGFGPFFLAIFLAPWDAFRLHFYLSQLWLHWKETLDSNPPRPKYTHTFILTKKKNILHCPELFKLPSNFTYINLAVQRESSKNQISHWNCTIIDKSSIGEIAVRVQHPQLNELHK